MGMPQLRQSGSKYHECGKAYLRLYWDTVLEPGEDTGDLGKGASFIVSGIGIRAAFSQYPLYLWGEECYNVKIVQKDVQAEEIWKKS